MPNITNFISKIMKSDLARPNKFQVVINIPPASNLPLLLGTQREITERISLMAKSVEFPGRGVTTDERVIHGPPRKMPYGQTFTQELPVTFLVGGDMFEKKFFDAWNDLVVSNDTHDFGFYDDYTTTIEVQQLDSKDNVVYAISVLEVFPDDVNSVELASDSNDTVMELSVNFAFRTWNPVPLFFNREFPGHRGFSSDSSRVIV